MNHSDDWSRPRREGALPGVIAARLKRAARRVEQTADRLGDGEAARAELDIAVAEILGAQRAAFGPRPRARRGEGGKQKILQYLTARVGREVHGDELAAISGIGEWARRVRELRIEHGYDIRQVAASTYVMESAEPDLALSVRWKQANEIRRRPGSAMERIKVFLGTNVGTVVTRDQIDYVARIAEGSRRVRELRDEHGWPINSHIDEPELTPGEYRLLSVDPRDRRDPLQRLYPENLRQQIFERDLYICSACGRDRNKAEAAGNTRFYLEVHHKTAVADELAALPKQQRNDPENLVTLCHACHVRETEVLHKQRRVQRRPPDARAR